MKKRMLVLKPLAVSFLFFFLSFFSTTTFAEGSRDLLTADGARGFLEYAPSMSYPLGGGVTLPRLTIINTFVRSGESLLLGSSANGINGVLTGRIIATNPQGASQLCPIGGVTGSIYSIDQELVGPFPGSGGYVPCVINIGSGNEGIWTIEFIAPGVGGSTGYAGFADRVQSTASPVAARDVSVRSELGAIINGRSYTNFLNMFYLGNNSLITTRFFVLTPDGYIYEKNFFGARPLGFSFFSSNKGIENLTTDESLFLSVPQTQLGLLTGIRNPALVDSGTDVTNKIFFNPPSNDLPESSFSPRGYERLKQDTPVYPAATGFTFVGSEGTVGQIGQGMTGSFMFSSPSVMQYEITLDINNNFVFGDGNDVLLKGTAQPGSNTIVRDGKDAQGIVLTGLQSGLYNVQIVFLGGVVHFPLIDIEDNLSGIRIKRLNGVGPGETTIYYDDRLVGGVSRVSTGEDSSLGGHRRGINQGNNRVMDTWSYIKGETITLTGFIDIVQADLSIQKIALSSGNIPGSFITYLLTVENLGPNTASGARVVDDLSAQYFDTASWSCWYASGGGCGNGSGSLSVDLFVTLASGQQAYVLITGLISSSYSGSSITNTGYVLRPNDTTDPTDPLRVGSGNNSDSADITVYPVADLAIQIQGNQVAKGSGANILVRNIHYQQLGLNTSTGSYLLLSLPANLDTVQISGGVVSGNTILIPLDSLVPGSSGQLFLTGSTVLSSGFFQLGGIISASTYDYDLGNNTSTGFLSVSEDPFADFAVITPQDLQLYETGSSRSGQWSFSHLAGSDSARIGTIQIDSGITLTTSNQGIIEGNTILLSGQMSPGDVLYVTVEGIIQEVGEMLLSGYIYGLLPDPNIDNNLSTGTIVGTGWGDPVLSGTVNTGATTGIVNTGVVNTGVLNTGVTNTGIVNTGTTSTGAVSTGISSIPSNPGGGGGNTPPVSLCQIGSGDQCATSQGLIDTITQESHRDYTRLLVINQDTLDTVSIDTAIRELYPTIPPTIQTGDQITTSSVSLFTLPKKLLDTGTPVDTLRQLGVDVLFKPKLDTQQPDWIRMRAADEAIVQDLKYRVNQLPYSQDQQAERYIVIPRLGVVSPIVHIPTDTSDFSALIDGRDIKVNRYLQNGVLHYPLSAQPGHIGNMVIAGHSSYYKDDPGRYHTIFSSLMLLKSGDEVRVYDKYSEARDLSTYVMHRYQVQQSYNTIPTDVQVLLPQEGVASMTIFTCTPVGGISGRRIIKGTYLGTPHNPGQHRTSTTRWLTVQQRGYRISTREQNAIDKLIDAILKNDEQPKMTLMILFARVRQLMQQDDIPKDFLRYLRDELARAYVSLIDR